MKFKLPKFLQRKLTYITPLQDASPLIVRVLNEGTTDLGVVLGITDERKNELAKMVNLEITKNMGFAPFEAISKNCKHANELVFVTWHMADACFIKQMRAMGIVVIPMQEPKK